MPTFDPSPGEDAREEMIRKASSQLPEWPPILKNTVHDLKTWPSEFEAVLTGKKAFEFRRDDRGFKVGDVLHLREWRPCEREHTGRELYRLVTYVLPGGAFGAPDGYCIMSMKRCLLLTAFGYPVEWREEAHHLSREEVNRYIHAYVRHQEGRDNAVQKIPSNAVSTQYRPT